jgi:hypothetical protein
MEHRCSERVTTDLKVLIYKLGIPVAIGRLKNGSKLGFFVETDFADINVLQPLDIEVLLQQGPHNLERYKYTTRVIRKADAGLGLELEHMSVEAAQALDKLLHSPQARQQPKPALRPVADVAQVAAKLPKKVAQAN